MQKIDEEKTKPIEGTIYRSENKDPSIRRVRLPPNSKYKGVEYFVNIIIKLTFSLLFCRVIIQI